MKLADVPENIRVAIVQLYSAERVRVPDITKRLNVHGGFNVSFSKQTVYGVLRDASVLRDHRGTPRTDVPAREVKDLLAYGFTQLNVAAMYRASLYLVGARLRAATPPEKWRRSPRPSPKATAIAEDLIRRFRRYEYSVGDKLPTEHALAQRYDVTAETVRRALVALRETGWIEARGRGGPKRGHYYCGIPRKERYAM